MHWHVIIPPGQASKCLLYGKGFFRGKASRDSIRVRVVPSYCTRLGDYRTLCDVVPTTFTIEPTYSPTGKRPHRPSAQLSNARLVHHQGLR